MDRTSAFTIYASFCIYQTNYIVVLGQPGCHIQGLQKISPELVDQRHFTGDIIDSNEALVKVDKQADSCDLGDFQGYLQAGVPGGETSAAVSHTPGEGVAGDAAIDALPLAFDAFVRESYMRALPAQLRLDVVPPLVQALQGQRLMPALEAVRVFGIAVLPGAGVGELSVVVHHA